MGSNVPPPGSSAALAYVGRPGAFIKRLVFGAPTTISEPFLRPEGRQARPSSTSPGACGRGCPGTCVMGVRPAPGADV